MNCDEAVTIMKSFIENHKDKEGNLAFDGVFAHTDYHGYLFMELLRQEGFRVPEDVQVIGLTASVSLGTLRTGCLCPPSASL